MRNKIQGQEKEATMIDANVPKIHSLFGLMIVLIFGFALSPTPASGHPCDRQPPPHKHCDNEPGPVITYKAGLTSGAFVFDPVDVTPNAKQNTLQSSSDLMLIRPLEDPERAGWNAVFLACENFFALAGPLKIEIPDSFWVGAEDWSIQNAGEEDIRIGFEVEFMDATNTPFNVFVQLIGGPLDGVSFLPTESTTPSEFDLSRFWITGKTAKGYGGKRTGCVSGGSAPITNFSDGATSKVVITLPVPL